jgi:hypothetical protein
LAQGEGPELKPQYCKKKKKDRKVKQVLSRRRVPVGWGEGSKWRGEGG